MDKKKILILSANPKATPRLRLDEEVREIEEGLQRAKHRERFEIKSKWAVRLRDIRRALLDEEPNIVHFCGHGFEDAIIVEDEIGTAVNVNKDALANLFKLFKDKIECVLLVACFSQFQSKAISKYIDCVIGMKSIISDKAAIEFSVGFYDGLGAGRSVQEAFELGQNAVAYLNKGEHMIPKIFNKKNMITKDSDGDSVDDQPVELAIRSQRGFNKKGYGDDLDDKVHHLLCLCPHFKGRHLVNGTWEDIKEEITSFLDKSIEPGKRYNLHLPLHISLAFFVGREIPFKRGVEVNLYQSSPSSPRGLQQRSGKKGHSEYPDPWKDKEFNVNKDGNELAVAISVTHDISQDVETFVRKECPAVSHLLHIKLPETSHESIKNADHAFDFSSKAVGIIRDKYRDRNSSHLHLFISGPNYFTFYLGQHSLILNNITLYEFDLESGQEGAYRPSIQI
jgi:hypothetical protein